MKKKHYIPWKINEYNFQYVLPMSIDDESESFLHPISLPERVESIKELLEQQIHLAAVNKV